jgi:hemolysin activation/secretion protein
VVEGYISEVKVSGDVGPVRDLIQGYVDKITESRPARLEDIERYLLLANDVPGITAQGVMQPTTAADGATQLIVNVERDWFSGYARIDNRESDFTGPWRIIAAPGTNSITSLGERIQVTGLTAFDLPEEQYVGLAATGHVGSEGLQLGATFSYEETHPGSSFKVFDIDTNALRFGLAADYPIVRSRRTNLYLGGGFDYADIDTELGPVTIAGFTFSGATHDRLRVAWAGVRADHRDEWGGANLLEVHLRQGLPGLGSTESGDVEKSRVDADGTFTSFQLTAARRQRITDTLNLYLGGRRSSALIPAGRRMFGRQRNLAAAMIRRDCRRRLPAGTVELRYNPESRQIS